MDDLGLRGFVHDFFSGYGGDPLEDDPRPVIRTLERTAGHGNFEFLTVAG
jgi:hypothetical protein